MRELGCTVDACFWLLAGVSCGQLYWTSIQDWACWRKKTTEGTWDSEGQWQSYTIGLRLRWVYHSSQLTYRCWSKESASHIISCWSLLTWNSYRHMIYIYIYVLYISIYIYTHSNSNKMCVYIYIHTCIIQVHFHIFSKRWQRGQECIAKHQGRSVRGPSPEFGEKWGCPNSCMIYNRKLH